MGKAAALAECEHEDAMLIEDADLHRDFKGKTFFFCPVCGITLNDEGTDAGLDPTKQQVKSGEPHRPKAPAPLRKCRRRGMPGRTWSKDQTGKVPVSCQWAGCNNTYRAWANDPDSMQKYCPQLHRGLHKLLNLRARQKRFRERRKNSKT